MPIMPPSEMPQYAGTLDAPGVKQAEHPGAQLVDVYGPGHAAEPPWPGRSIVQQPEVLAQLRHLPRPRLPR